MKRIASFLALVLFSAFTFAAVNITVSPTSIDFGEVSIKGKSYVQGETTLHLSWDLPLYSQVEVETLNQPAQDCGFSVDGASSTWIWTGSGYSSDPFITSYDLPVSFTAQAAGSYSCQIHIYVYDPDNTTDYVIIAEKTVTASVIVTNDAIVPKTIPFERIESTSGLKNGDTIVFVCESAQEACGPLDGAALSAIGITLNAGKADIPEDGIQMFKAEKFSGYWQFYTVETTPKRLHLDIVSNNAKGAFTYADTQAGAILANWGVEITNGDAVVSRPDDDQTYPVRWVSGSTGGRFKPYKNVTGSDISIYKKVGSAVDIQSKLEIGAIDFGTVELDEVKEVVVNYTGENLTADIEWDFTGTDAALFSVTPTSSTNRTSGSVTVKYLGTAAAVKTINAKLYALTQDAKLDDLEKEIPISITLAASTIKLTKIEFVGAPDSIVCGKSIDLKPYLVFTPSNAVDKSLTWTVDKSYQGSVVDGVFTATTNTGKVVVTATSVKVPTVSASVELMNYVPKPKTVTLNKHELTTYIGVNDTLQALVSPDGASQKCWYTSRNTSIITCKKGNVDGAGVLTVKALCPEGVWVIVNPGSSATEYPNIKDSCLVKVVPVTVESVAFDPNTHEMTVGAQYQLTPVVTPSAAASQYTASYESNNTSVATVSETGLVTAKAEGTAKITCTLGGKSGQITINVVGAKYFTKVTDATTLKANDTIILAGKATINEVLTNIVAGAVNASTTSLDVVSEGVSVVDNTVAADKALVFVLGGSTDAFTLTAQGVTGINTLSSSDNTKIEYKSSKNTWKFETTSDGVKVMNASYTTASPLKYIQYNSSSKRIRMYQTSTTSTPLYVYVRSYQAPVLPDPTAVELDQISYDTHVGDPDVTLKATVKPSGASQEVIWESSNTDVATVNANGKVHPKTVGQAIITAKAKADETIKATCTVNVIAWTVEYVEFDIADDLNLEVGEQETVTATAYPTGHGFKVDYYTSNENIATVTIGGVVTGVAAGDAVITAKSGDKEAKLNVHVTAAPVPEDKGEISIAGFLAAKDEFNIYTLTGVVSNIKMASDGLPNKYGNFDLTDETGKIYIYGLLTADGVAQKFREMGIEAKDTVTLKGSYSEHNGDPQVKNALFVSVKKYVDPTTAIEAVGVRTKATKVIREGQVIIIREEKEFDVVGRRVK